MQRYSRQIILPHFGTEAQTLLSNAKVLVVGAGGLGAPVLQYLTAAGIGTLGIADGDTIEISNLQRQVLYNEIEIGKKKAKIAQEKLTKLNTEIQFEVYDCYIDPTTIFEIIELYDIVVDCTDHFSIRYLLNDVCSIHKKPLVFASIYQFEAQLSVFHYGDNPYNLRDVFSEIPDEKAIPNCSEAGVIGTLAGITGSLQANEVIKIITKIGTVNSGKVLIFNSLYNEITQLIISKNPSVEIPVTKEDVLKNTYGVFCKEEFSVDTLNDLQQILYNPHTVLIDVREENEVPKITQFQVLEIPLSKIPENTAILQHYDTMVFICKSGVRSKIAIEKMRNLLPSKIYYSVKNGIQLIQNEK